MTVMMYNSVPHWDIAFLVSYIKKHAAEPDPNLSASNLMVTVVPGKVQDSKLVHIHKHAQQMSSEVDG